MRILWRSGLSLSVGLFLASAQAQETGQPEPQAPRVIASSTASPVAPPRVAPPSETPSNLGVVIASTPQRATGVKLGRPKAAPSVDNTTIEQVGYAPTAASVARAQSADYQLMPPGPGMTPVSTGKVSTAPLPVLAGAPASTPSFSAPAPTPIYTSNPVTVEGTSWDGMGGGIQDPYAVCDRFGCADGVIDEYNNLFYLQSEYLLWWMRGSRFPALATTGVANPPPFVPGALSAPNSIVVFGGESVGEESHSGSRTRFGVWLNRDHTIGLEGSYFMLAEDSDGFMSASNGLPLLAVPFQSANAMGMGGVESSVLVASIDPNNTRSGSVRAELETRLWGYEANLRRTVVGGPCGNFDVFAGYRGLGLDDNFELTSTSMITRPNVGMLSIQDRFSTRNRFHGGQLGAHFELRRGRCFFDVTSKIALGNTQQRIEIGGNTVVNGFSTPGGLFARTSNMGTFSRDRFAVVPEVGFNVGVQVTDTLRVSGGYNFLYWSNVVRPGEQIDRVVNLSGVGPARPTLPFRDSDFWVHGLTASMEFRY